MVKAMVFSSSHVWMWQLDHKESWVLKNWCFWTVVLEKTLERPLDSKEIKSVNPKGNQSWIFIGRTDAEDQAPIFWSPMQRTDSLEKTLMLGKIEGRRRRGRQRMRWLDGITDSTDMSLSKALGVGDGQGILACCRPWVAKCCTQLSNWTELNILAKPGHILMLGMRRKAGTTQQPHSKRLHFPVTCSTNDPDNFHHQTNQKPAQICLDPCKFHQVLSTSILICWCLSPESLPTLSSLGSPIISQSVPLLLQKCNTPPWTDTHNHIGAWN